MAGTLDRTDLLRRLADLDRRDRRRVFGASSHDYKLDPPLPVAVIEAFEGRHGLSLPEDYRLFITEIGNGGAGPYYRVLPFGKDDYDRDWEGGGLVGDPGKPFPHTAAWNLPDSFWDGEPDWPPDTPVEEQDRLMEAWDRVEEAHYWDPALMDGAIPVCHLGCALRQWLVVNLRRDFQAMIDRGGDGVEVGKRLLELSNRLFRFWHRVRDGTLEWEPFQARMRRLRREVRQTLEEGSRCPCARTAATWFEILKVEEGLWSFARVRGIEPTNNAAERALRFAVIWRRISGGTDSQGGIRFVERMLTMVATCRQQGRNVLEYLTSCFEADRRGHAIPSLLPARPAAIKVA